MRAARHTVVMRIASAPLAVLLVVGLSAACAPPVDAGPPDDDDDVPACAAAPEGDPLVRPTSTGAVRGVADGDTVFFGGIPFAAPPIGDLRFRAPAAPACRDEVLDATDFGAPCVQGAGGDEDCLTLNVWTPTTTSTTPRPVLFWIHGGANVSGSSGGVVAGHPPYDGEELAIEHDVVVVSANYRLGALGFLVHASLADEDGAAGNYALLDQIAALSWVRDEIASFGGDPDRVTVFGQSAGSYDACALYASPLARGLFASAILMSGDCHAPTQAQRATVHARLVAAVGCDDADDVAACLRDLDARALDASGVGQPRSAAPAEMVPFGPTVDGYVLPSSPLAAMEDGDHADVPLIVGSTADEWDLFQSPDSFATCAQVEQAMRDTYSFVASNVIALYPCDEANPGWAWNDAITDLAFTCPARRAARAVASSGAAPVRRYVFAHGRESGPLSSLRAFHGVELSFVFGVVGESGDVATDDEEALSTTMKALWAEFAKDGDPTGGALPAWPTSADDALVIGVEPSVAPAYDEEECDFWDTIPLG